jgi:DNA topoisomerase-1
MQIAQRLFQGMEIGNGEIEGLITYHRTDSTTLSEKAINESARVIRDMFGGDFYDGPRRYQTKVKNAQEAHEAIRPTDFRQTPQKLASLLEPDELKLYDLIWKRTMASQMVDARVIKTTLEITAPAGSDGSAIFTSSGKAIEFAGFRRAYVEGSDDPEAELEDQETILPTCAVGDRVYASGVMPSGKEGLAYVGLDAKRHETLAPARYTEAALIKELEAAGIGRPSTYASIISVLADRRYVELTQRRFFPTELGESVEKVMVKQFPDIFNVDFTSEMEQELDKIEEGDLGWQKVLKDFYSPFAARLNKVDAPSLIAEAYDLSKVHELRCPECGGKLEPRGGFFGPFLACENHPKKCKYTRPIKGEKAKPVMTEYKCHVCGAPMVIRTGRSGQFLGCSTFPKCRGTRSLPTGVFCPKDGGELVERRSRKRGTAFYACANEDCDFVAWNKPVNEKCPECGFVGAEMKFNKTRGDFRKCLKCGNEWDGPKVDEPLDAEPALAG